MCVYYCGKMSAGPSYEMNEHGVNGCRRCVVVVAIVVLVVVVVSTLPSRLGWRFLWVIFSRPLDQHHQAHTYHHICKYIQIQCVYVFLQYMCTNFFGPMQSPERSSFARVPNARDDKYIYKSCFRRLWRRPLLRLMLLRQSMNNPFCPA